MESSNVMQFATARVSGDQQVGDQGCCDQCGRGHPGQRRVSMQGVYWRRRLLVALLAVGMVWLALQVAHAAGPVDEARAGVVAGGQVQSDSEQHVVTVAPGDTLWSLAVEHGTSRDVRDDVVILREMNGLTSPTLRHGQQLLVPVS